VQDDAWYTYKYRNSSADKKLLYYACSKKDDGCKAVAVVR
jgi:hypothetical protein